MWPENQKTTTTATVAVVTTSINCDYYKTGKKCFQTNDGLFSNSSRTAPKFGKSSVSAP